MNRVVITGVGALTPIGNSVDEMWANLLAGRHGFSLGSWFPGQTEDENVKALVKDFDELRYMEKKELRRNDLFTQYAVFSAMEALKDSGTDFKDVDPYTLGVIVGSGLGGILTLESEIEAYYHKGNNKVNVFTVPKMIPNMAAGVIAIRTGFKGGNHATVSACASGTHAVGEAFHAIKNGYMTAAIAGGTEACTTGFAFAGFNNMHAITRTTDVDRASIPFDKERSGFVLGEGSGMLVLEELEHALARGAKIYAEIGGYGATCDAHHETAPDPDGSGSAKAMEFAVKEAGLQTADIGYINAHGTSTPINDRTETAAIKRLFGDHAKNIAVNSTKSMTGHMLGAAGAVEAIVTALSLKNGIVHQTLGYKVADEDCDLDYVAEGARKADIKAALSNSLGFGGHNACLCLKKYTD